MDTAYIFPKEFCKKVAAFGCEDGRVIILDLTQLTLQLETIATQCIICYPMYIVTYMICQLDSKRAQHCHGEDDQAATSYIKAAALCRYYHLNFFLIGISRWIIIPLAAIAIARTNPTPSHNTTAVYPIPKSVRIFDLGRKRVSVDDFPFYCHLASDEYEQFLKLSVFAQISTLRRPLGRIRSI